MFLKRGSERRTEENRWAQFEIQTDVLSTIHGTIYTSSRCTASGISARGTGVDDDWYLWQSEIGQGGVGVDDQVPVANQESAMVEYNSIEETSDEIQ